jgi:GT2 family glycosyltransferase
MGFAFSVNRGASFAEDEYVLFLNSDTVVIPGELGKMISFMDNNADAAICGPQLVYPDMKLQRSYAVVPSLFTEFFFRGRPRARCSGSDVQVPTHGDPVHSPLAVGSLIGAAILVRKSILTAISGFDERFFFFLEETDLCVRVRRIGYKVVFFPDARIIHLQGKTVRKSWIKGRMEYNISLRKFIKKHHGPAYYSAFVAIRFIKTLFSVVFFPLVFFGRRMRIKYVYYLMLMKWYVKGCPDDMGLRP